LNSMGGPISFDTKSLTSSNELEKTTQLQLSDSERILKRIESPMHGEFMAPRGLKRIKRIFITLGWTMCEIALIETVREALIHTSSEGTQL
jgi:hypothetical protein